MSVNTLFFNYGMGSGLGMCVLCDTDINRNKFSSINQKLSGNHEVRLLSQIIHSQTQINSVVKNSKNEKVSIIANIHHMTQEDFTWNNDFDVVGYFQKPHYLFLLTPNNRSLLSLCAAYL